MASLQSIKPGDIVKVDIKGRQAFAEVLSKGNRRLKIRPITPNFNWLEVTGGQVIEHWRKTRNTRRSRSTGHDAG